ncbi:MAG: replicative DNA helicase [candidate division NC10 bacterium]|nr:replicative DNA helicase [candidate division NC10 bacterium]MBI4390881.1 replicative DNA helicase [candidate division NC10 bacterium]
MTIPQGKSDRIPPQNLEAEVAVLGALLQDSEALLKAIDALRPDHFYREAHRRVFDAALALFARNEPVDLITLTDELRRRGELEGVGGPAALAALVEAVPTAANVAYHARIVRDKALLRHLIATATEVVGMGYEDVESVDEVLDLAERRIFEISQDKVSRAFVPVKDILKGTFEHIERLYERQAHITGVPTGFRRLDDLTSGLQAADLIIIAGRPSMGKTSFALNVAVNAAKTDPPTPVAIFSLEMAKEQVVQRMLCTEARVDSHKLRTGKLGSRDWPELTRAAGRLSEMPVYIDDTPAITTLEIRAKARRLRTEGQLGLIIVDYLQLIRGRGRVESRQQEISEISRGLKALAKEVNVPVMALSQLSRAVESRTPPRPQLSDLRESGAIEQDADVVAFLYRKGFYEAQERARKTEVAGLGEELAEEDRTTEVLVSKQRNGPTGSVLLTFLREYTRFEDQEERRAPL